MLKNAARDFTDSSLAIRTKPWPTYDKGDVVLDDEDERAIVRALRSHLLFRYDKRPLEETEVGKLEAALRAYFHVPHALAVSSGTTAIALGLMACGVKHGDLVACPGFTFAATPSAILLAGGRPLLIEVDENLHFDLADLKRKMTPQVKAIVVVHMRGFASDVEEIVEYGRKLGVPVIEDAVPALGAKINGKHLGTIGAVGAFSTQSDKSLNTGEGGFMLISDDEVFSKAAVYSGAFESRLKKHLNPFPNFVDDLALPIFSFRMDEIRGALAASQLKKLDQKLVDHHANYNYVAEALKSNPHLQIRQPVAPGAFLGESLIFRLPELDACGASRFCRALRSEGIDARCFGDEDDTNIRCFWNWRFLYPSKSQEEIKELLPDSTRFLETAIDIPMSSTLTRDDCDDLLLAAEKVSAEMFHSQGANELLTTRQNKKLGVRRWSSLA